MPTPALPDSPGAADHSTTDALTWTADTPLRAVPKAVDRALAGFFADSHACFGHIDPLVDDAITMLERFVIDGGKRVRPTFAWAGVRAALEGGGGSEAEMHSDPSTPAALLTAVSSLEFVQACALIHDDIIDASDTRRGRPTVHRNFEAQHRDAQWVGSPEHYGMSQAILVGDLAFAWADDMFATSGAPVDALQRARGPWRAMRTEVIAGQQLDIVAETSVSESLEMAMKVIRYKTASYTVTRPLHLGAALGGADERTTDLLRRCGDRIGTAFQLRDDQLGVFGDPEITGKPSGDDLRTGKRTALITWALEHGSKAEAEALHRGLGHVRDEADVDRLRDVIASTGALHHAESTIAEETDTAIRELQASWLSSAYRDETTAFIEQLTHRSS